MAKIRILILFIVLSSCASNKPTLAQSVETEITAIENNLHRSIQIMDQPRDSFSLKERMKYHNVPGVGIAIVKNGKLHWAKSYGFRDSDTKKPVNDSTLFQAASVSKAITALAILKLVQEDLLDLDTDVNSYLKQWQVPDNEFTKSEKVTIRRLLTHTAGLNVHGFDGYPQGVTLPSAQEILSGEGNSRAVEIINTPGNEWRYSGAGYVILQMLVEETTGRDFEEYMNSEILPALDMNLSTYQFPINTKRYTNISSGHTEDGEVMPGRWNNIAEKGPGGLWTTPIDLAYHCIAIHEMYTRKKHGLLTKETLEKMFDKHSDRDWGLGPLIEGEGDDLIFRHDGKNIGYLAEYIAFVNRSDAVIIMTNGDKGNRIISELLNAVSDYYDWDISNPRMITSPKMDVAELQKFTGTYQWSERPSYHIEVVIQDDKLNLIASGFPTDVLIPFNQLEFIDIESAVEVIFTQQNGTIGGLNWRGRFDFIKID